MTTVLRRRRTNSVSSPRLLAALPDPRVAAIEKAVGKCAPAGHRRENLMHGRYAWPKHFVALLDELNLHSVPHEDILGLELALRDAVHSTLYAGNAAPLLTVGEALALESEAEGLANSAASLLVDTPNSPGALTRVLELFGLHAARLQRARLILRQKLERLGHPVA